MGFFLFKNLLKKNASNNWILNHIAQKYIVANKLFGAFALWGLGSSGGNIQQFPALHTFP